MKTYWLLNDQLHRNYLKNIKKNKDHVLFIEAYDHFHQHSYHKQRIFFLIAAMRNFANDLKKNGYAVTYIKAATIEEGWSSFIADQNNSETIISMPVDYNQRQKIQQLMQSETTVTFSHNENTKGNFMFSEDELLDMAKNSKTQESFYRKARIKTEILIENKQKPVGGKWNYDTLNRKPAKNITEKPGSLPVYSLNRISKDALSDCQARFQETPGKLDSLHLPLTRKDALDFLDNFIENRLAGFGPYQDAMLSGHPFMFHSLLSAHLNCGLLCPNEVIQKVLDAYQNESIPLSSAEGFIRQIIGWREFVRAVYLQQMPEYLMLNYFDHQHSLPDFFWTADTELHCLAETLQDVLTFGYSHHIQRLMVLSNFANLIFVKPSILSDWFNQMYTDSWDWVVVPNVIGMSMYADGGLMATKPYISSGKYIQKMSNYCINCRYDPAEKTTPDACPFNSLYWNFISRHKEKLQNNPRMNLILSQWGKMDQKTQAAILEKASAIQQSFFPKDF